MQKEFYSPPPKSSDDDPTVPEFNQSSFFSSEILQQWRDEQNKQYKLCAEHISYPCTMYCFDYRCEVQDKEICSRCVFKNSLHADHRAIQQKILQQLVQEVVLKYQNKFDYNFNQKQFLEHMKVQMKKLRIKLAKTLKEAEDFIAKKISEKKNHWLSERDEQIQTYNLYRKLKNSEKFSFKEEKIQQIYNEMIQSFRVYQFEHFNIFQDQILSFHETLQKIEKQVFECLNHLKDEIFTFKPLNLDIITSCEAFRMIDSIQPELQNYSQISPISYSLNSLSSIYKLDNNQVCVKLAQNLFLVSLDTHSETNQISSPHFGNILTCINFETHYLMVTTEDPYYIYIYDLRNTRQYFQMQPIFSGQFDCAVTSVFHDKNMFYYSERNSIWLMQAVYEDDMISRLETIQKLTTNQFEITFLLHFDKEHFVSVDQSSLVTFYDLKSHQEIASIQQQEFIEQIEKLDSEHLICLIRNRGINIWNWKKSYIAYYFGIEEFILTSFTILSKNFLLVSLHSGEHFPIVWNILTGEYKSVILPKMALQVIGPISQNFAIPITSRYIAQKNLILMYGHMGLIFYYHPQNYNIFGKMLDFE